MQRVDSLRKALGLGKTEDKGEGGSRGLDSITDSVDMNLSKLPVIVKSRETWHVSMRL